ncbi:hypothetical protein [Rubritalea tangerina]|uniref:hypothetical protein n=1 Tax=Rubritalea tangerina TaxID=430798 RepID=UPI00361AC822
MSVRHRGTQEFPELVLTRHEEPTAFSQHNQWPPPQSPSAIAHLRSMKQRRKKRMQRRKSSMVATRCFSTFCRSSINGRTSFIVR